MKLRYLLYPVLLLFLLSGCAHVSSDHTKSDESNLKGETALSPSGEDYVEKMHQDAPLMEMADSTLPRRIWCKMELMADSLGLTTCSMPMACMRGK